MPNNIFINMFSPKGANASRLKGVSPPSIAVFYSRFLIQVFMNNSIASLVSRDGNDFEDEEIINFECFKKTDNPGKFRKQSAE